VLCWLGAKSMKLKLLALVALTFTVASSDDYWIGLSSVARAADTPSPLCSPPAPPAWLPVTPPANETQVPAPRSASDCGFYMPAWQRFLNVTQPDGTAPAFLTSPYLSFDEIFAPVNVAGVRSSQSVAHVLTLAARNIQRPNEFALSDTQFSDISQAGLRGVLIDQRGRPVYYAIHVNAEFQSFLIENNLTTLAGLAAINQTLPFPTGILELKSAWMIVDNIGSAPNYFVVPAKVPHYIVANGVVTPKIDATTHQPVMDDVFVAMIALHVVFTLPGHPEMIWSTFEHIHVDPATGEEKRDNAPAASANPSKTPPNTPIDSSNYPLYKAGTIASAANLPIDPKVLADHFDETSQSFTKGGTLQTSVYRPYPGSKTDGDGTDPHAADEDDEVILINQNIAKMFKAANSPASDLRQNYRLVGAVWINNPDRDFKANRSFKDPLNLSTDDDSSMLAGEGRLGSTAIESFTEFEDTMPNGRPNCFSCHDTSRVVDDQDPSKKLMPFALLNVSHVMSRFVDQQKSAGK
jgi:hypothetical protein